MAVGFWQRLARLGRHQHEGLLCAEAGRLFLRCRVCLRESAGWAPGGADARGASLSSAGHRARRLAASWRPPAGRDFRPPTNVNHT